MSRDIVTEATRSVEQFMHKTLIEHTGHYAEPNEATNWRITCTCGWRQMAYGLSRAEQDAAQHKENAAGATDESRARAPHSFSILSGSSPAARADRRSCSWCHATVNLSTDDSRVMCANCGHRGDVPRADCDCRECTRWAIKVARLGFRRPFVSPPLDGGNSWY